MRCTRIFPLLFQLTRQQFPSLVRKKRLISFLAKKKQNNLNVYLNRNQFVYHQMKNEELCRIQNELEQECDQFRKLKKIIQDHGLPNHEQLVILQQQVRLLVFFTFKNIILIFKMSNKIFAVRYKIGQDMDSLNENFAIRIFFDCSTN